MQAEQLCAGPPAAQQLLLFKRAAACYVMIIKGGGVGPCWLEKRCAHTATSAHASRASHPLHLKAYQSELSSPRAFQLSCSSPKELSRLGMSTVLHAFLWVMVSFLSSCTRECAGRRCLTSWCFNTLCFTHSQLWCLVGSHLMGETESVHRVAPSSPAAAGMRAQLRSY